MSTRPDLIPQDYIIELQKLQDEVPPFAYDQVEQIINRELGADIPKIFKSFEQKPFAAASLGQVHQAILEDGDKAVVKVQRLYGPVGIVEEFTKVIRSELDYGTEGRNAERLRKNFEDDKTIYTPKIYWEFSSRRILTMELIEGIKINNLKELNKVGYNRKKIAENVAKAFIKQILIDGFFHADPHPGNMLVMKDGIIGFMDFGMMGRLDEFHS